MKTIAKSLFTAAGHVWGVRAACFIIMSWMLRTFALPMSWRNAMIWPMATYILGDDFTRVMALGTGPTLKLTLDDTINRLVLFYGQLRRYCYEPQTLRLAVCLQPANGKTINAGAHMGYHALHLAEAVKDSGGQVYAFEPVHKYYGQLKCNRELSELNNLIVEPMALAASSQAQIKLYLVGARSCIEATTPHAEDHFQYVEAVSLDDYARRREIDSVDLILLDVEGSELNVLCGADTLLASKPDLILEVNRSGLSNQGRSPDDLYGFLRDRGYQCYFIADDYFRKMRGRDLRKIVLQPIEFEDANFQPGLKAFNIVATCSPSKLSSPEIVLRDQPVGHRRSL